MELKTSIAAQTYAHARSAAAPQPLSGGADEGFGAVANEFAQTLNQGEQTAKSAMVGQADPHALVQALAASELAVDTVVAVRNKVVEAYQEILRMPV